MAVAVVGVPAATAPRVVAAAVELAARAESRVGPATPDWHRDLHGRRNVQRRGWWNVERSRWQIERVQWPAQPVVVNGLCLLLVLLGLSVGGGRIGCRGLFGGQLRGGGIGARNAGAEKQRASRLTAPATVPATMSRKFKITSVDCAHNRGNGAECRCERSDFGSRSRRQLSPRALRAMLARSVRCRRPCRGDDGTRAGKVDRAYRKVSSVRRAYWQQFGSRTVHRAMSASRCGR
jgi:hypothetical protein